MSKIERLSAELAYSRSTRETARELAQCDWNDGVGRSLKDQIEWIVDRKMDEAEFYYLNKLNDIKTEDIESDLQLAWAHLRS
jgi:hypothetical protein